jgi:hypothetical protein
MWRKFNEIRFTQIVWMDEWITSIIIIISSALMSLIQLLYYSTQWVIFLVESLVQNQMINRAMIEMFFY